MAALRLGLARLVVQTRLDVASVSQQVQPVSSSIQDQTLQSVFVLF